jgi:hypothetical protein
MKHIPAILLGLALLLIAYTRSHFFDIAMERDEGIYVYFGHLITQGKVPYLDFYETRFPGIFYMYALLVAVFGYSIKGVAVGILVFVLAGAWLLYDTTKRLFSNSAALIAVFAFAFLSLAPDISGFTRQSEHIVNFWVLAGLNLTVRGLDSQRWWQYFGAGVCLCMALLVKPNAVYLIPAVGIVLVAHALSVQPTAWKRLIVNGLIYSAGVFAMFGLMCLYMASKGAWSVFYEFAIVEAGKYAEGFTWDNGKELFTGTYKSLSEKYGALLWLSYLALPLLWFMQIPTYKKTAYTVLFAAGFMTITPGLRFYGHYWLMWMPFVAMGAGVCAYAVQGLLAQFVKSDSVAKFAPLAFVLPLFAHFSGNNAYYTSPNHAKVLKKTYGDNPFNDVKKIGDFLKNKVKPGDKIALVGSEPQLLVYTNCESPTKHAYFTYLMLDTLKTPQAKVWQEEYKRDVTREKPRFMFFASHPVSIYANEHSEMRFFDWFNAYINTNYDRIGCIEYAEKGKTNYVLDQQAVKTFRPASKYFLDVYERKPGN